MFYYYHIDEASLFRTSKQRYCRSLNNLHDPILNYIYLFNHLSLKEALNICETYQELVAYVLSKIRRFFHKEISITEVEILYICPQNKDKEKYCITNNSLTNIVNHYIQFHNACVTCEKCSKKLKSLCSIQRHSEVFSDSNVNDWQVYKAFYLSLHKPPNKSLNDTATFEDNLITEECYSLHDFQKKFSNKEVQKLSYGSKDSLIVDAQAEYKDHNQIVEALNKNIQNLRSELQQAVIISNQQTMEDIDDRANELLRNVLASRNGRYDLSFNNFSSTDSVHEVTFETTESIYSDNDSVGSIWGHYTYELSNEVLDDSEDNFASYWDRSSRDSSETIQYWMASRSTLLDDAELVHLYANSESSTISVFEGYHVENLLEEDEWDLYVQNFFY